MVRIHQIHRPALVGPVNLDRIWKLKKRLLGQLAHEQRRDAISPRPDKPFDVGAGLIVLTPKHELMCIGTSNFKERVGPRQHMCPDYCAEMFGIKTARKMKGRIIGMVIEAPPQADDFSGYFKEGVTVSCGFCRYEYRLELKDPDSPLTADTWLRFNHPTNRKKFLEKQASAFLALFPNDPKQLDPKHLAKRGGP
ncbi:MAG: hypothetical protein UY94_C0034G0005 [Parcubacteria group bacterium GW2011_GWA2_56_21]|nr:MAG: hypothetical protein UY94_C0034G0005 [Parcubacteria group bacterium GW2011_GWA2_56_21]